MLINRAFATLSVNTSGRDFVVGDIHGHSALLDALLASVRFDSVSDRLLALGDLIDRGPDSLQLLERVRDEPWFYSVRGNHEEMLQESIDDSGMERIWRSNGGMWGDRLMKEKLRVLSAIVGGMPVAMEVPLQNGMTMGLIHAELSTFYDWHSLRSLDVEPQSNEDHRRRKNLLAEALWGRKRITDLEAVLNLKSRALMDELDRARVSRSLTAVPDVDLLIAGHSTLANREVARTANLLWIDTCTYEPGGALTMVEPLTGQYRQASYREGLTGEVVVTDCGLLPPPHPDAQSLLQPTD